MPGRKLRVACVALLLAAGGGAVRAEPAAEGVAVDQATTQNAARESAARRDSRMAWWREAKFGLFIHWGVYSVPAGKYGEKDTYGEWIMHSCKIPAAEYRKFAGQFNPVKYDPAAWAQLAQDAGMKYIVITSKHHDGFALFPSAVSTWDVADATPYGKDLLGPLVEAGKARGLKTGFYYSQAQDWIHPGGAKARFEEGEGWDPAHRGSFDTYLRDIGVPQVRELLERYPIDILWWDTPTHMNRDRATPLAEMVRARPNLITNNRLGGGFGGDTSTPEQFVPITGYPGDWETCMTMNRHWGYNAADDNWKSTTELVRKLADICSKGGNFLLNVGPTAEGEIPAASVQRLREMGVWLKANGESIYGTKAGPFSHLSWGCATSKGNRLYLHVFDWPADGKLRVPLDNEASGARLLTSPDTKLTVTREPGRLFIDVPSAAPDPMNSVVVLELTAPPVVRPLPSAGAKAVASATLEGNAVENIFDGTGSKRWRAPKEDKSAWVQIDLREPATISGFGLDEPDVWPRLKQKYTLEVKDGDTWKPLATGTTDGHGLKKAITPTIAQKFRIVMECETGSPGIAEFQLYRPE